jgi:hypothetical protein
MYLRTEVGDKGAIQINTTDQKEKPARIKSNMTLLPRMKASPYLARSCPSTYLQNKNQNNVSSTHNCYIAANKSYAALFCLLHCKMEVAV